MFVFYDWSFPHMCTLHRMYPIFLLILGSVFSDCVVFCGDYNSGAGSVLLPCVTQSAGSESVRR